MADINGLKNWTEKFFNAHCKNSDCSSKCLVENCFKWIEYSFKGTLPGGKNAGCYAIGESNEIVYIGIARSKGWGIYQGCSLGARFNNHVLQMDKTQKGVKIQDRIYKMKDKWDTIKDPKLYTCAFPQKCSYLACALEAFLIDEMKPQHNKVGK